MQESNFENLIQEKNINEATVLWMTIVAALCDKHAPIKEVRIKSNTEGIPWYNDEITSLIAVKQSALDYDRRKGTCASKRFLSNITNKLNHLKRRMKRKYFREKVEEQSQEPKKLWSILKEVSRTETCMEEFLPDCVDQKVVDNFNSYFATVGITIQQTLGVSFTYDPKTSNTGFSFKEVSKETVIKLIDPFH